MLSFIVGKAIHSNFALRYDGNPKLRYETAEEAGCNSKPFSFYSGKNLLRGEKLYVGDIAKCQKALVFFHGIGAGHTAYTLELSFFAKKGYLVYAFDNTGCMWSEGKEVGDLAQSVGDVNAFFTYLKQDKDFHGQPLFALGHSWGGVSVLHCLNEDIPVLKCVSLSGATPLVDFYTSAEKKMPDWLKKPIAAYLKRKYGKAVVEDINLLTTTKKPFLYLYGDQDDLVLRSSSHLTIGKYAKTNSCVEIRPIKGKRHNSYWTEKTELYIQELVGKKKYTSLKCDPSVEFSLDFIKDDPAVMNYIFDFYER